MATPDVLTSTRHQIIIGWVAVAMATIVASFFGFLGGVEGITNPFDLLMHSIGTLILIVIAIISVRWPKIGSGFFFAIAAVIIWGVLTSSLKPFGTNAIWLGLLYSSPLVVPLITAGVLFLLGRPSPLKIAYAVMVIVPLLILGVTYGVGIIIS